MRSPVKPWSSHMGYLRVAAPIKTCAILILFSESSSRDTGGTFDRSINPLLRKLLRWTWGMAEEVVIMMVVVALAQRSRAGGSKQSSRETLCMQIIRKTSEEDLWEHWTRAYAEGQSSRRRCGHFPPSAFRKASSIHSARRKS